MTDMIPGKTKPTIEEKSREELIAIIHELLADIEGLKGGRTNSRNSSPPSSRDFKSDGAKKRKRHTKCQVNLLDQVPERTIRRQVTELPEIKPVLIETRQHEVRCPCCHQLRRGKLPDGLEAGRQVGPRLEATVTSLHHEHHLGYERVGRVCEEIFGITLSKGGAVSIVERAGRAAQREAEAIGEQVRQICLSHQIRNLQGLIEKRPRLQWAQDMQALFRKAIHLGKRRAQLTKEGFAKQVAVLEKHLKQLLQRTFCGLGENLLKRYRKYRDCLFVFLHRADVPAHNNACERALRPSSIARSWVVFAPIGAHRATRPWQPS